jgi:hypothetical protein
MAPVRTTLVHESGRFDSTTVKLAVSVASMNARFLLPSLNAKRK